MEKIDKLKCRDLIIGDKSPSKGLAKIIVNLNSQIDKLIENQNEIMDILHDKFKGEIATVAGVETIDYEEEGQYHPPDIRLVKMINQEFINLV